MSNLRNTDFTGEFIDRIPGLENKIKQNNSSLVSLELGQPTAFR